MTTDTQTLVGRLSPPSGRRPTVAEADRVCAAAACDTRLNRFNLSARCYRHRERKFPRVRGVTREERREMGLEA